MFENSLPQPQLDSPLILGLLSFDGRHGLPNSLREALLGVKQGEAALALDALFAAGFSIGKTFTVQSALRKLREVGIATSEALMRRALNSGLFPSIMLRSGRRGRPTRQYQMPDVMVLIQQYARGVYSATDELSLGDLHTLNHYRQSLHREFIRRAPGIYSRAFLARRLGIGKRTTRNYDLRVGIKAIRRLSQQNLKYLSNWQDLVSTGHSGLNWLRIQFDDGRFFDAPLLVGIAERHLWKMGVQGVYLVTQLCNRYLLSKEEAWADYQFLRLHDDERAFAASVDPFALRDRRLTSDPTSATLMIDRKAYQAASDPISSMLPPDVAARRVVRNPFARVGE